MLILVEGCECPEGSSRIAIALTGAKLDHEVRKSEGNASPRIFEDQKKVAEGTSQCLKLVEQRRKERVMGKTGDTPSGNVVYS